jgi:ribonuclease D
VDCEGVDLSRFGKITLLSVATPLQCYVFDMLEPMLEPVRDFVKQLLEDPKVLKVIHDCRQDSDALAARLGIVLDGVHDTSAVDKCLSKSVKAKNLNDTLRFYGLPPNLHRDHIDYKLTPNYWEQRPISEQMLTSSSGDVVSLLKLYDAQLARAEKQGVSCEELHNVSQNNLKKLRNAQVVGVVGVATRLKGRVIGRGGDTINSLCHKYGTDIWGHPIGFSVFAETQQDFETTKRAIERLASH